MSNAIIVEVVIYVIWTTIFLTRLRRRSLDSTEELLMIFFAIPIAIVMEIKNEYIYAEMGMSYPFSLFYFPDFKFPFAVVLSSSLSPWLFYVLSKRMTTYFLGEKSQLWLPLQLGIFLILIFTNIFTEWLIDKVGWVKWPKLLPISSQMTWAIQAAKYNLYFWMSFPPFLVAKFFSWRVRVLSRFDDNEKQINDS